MWVLLCLQCQHGPGSFHASLLLHTDRSMPPGPACRHGIVFDGTSNELKALVEAFWAAGKVVSGEPQIFCQEPTAVAVEARSCRWEKLQRRSISRASNLRLPCPCPCSCLPRPRRAGHCRGTRRRFHPQGQGGKLVGTCAVGGQGWGSASASPQPCICLVPHSVGVPLPGAAPPCCR